ncbi:MAG: hypothetical protein JRG97_06755 [Deltaproteobacteria bacterium]|nr:hypothetical protein [Deltaproteobacteria bacterium]MBW2053745.1 hypothetical protein [Deltaproteobacteria bacterium]MBW2140756.1 hypothetical protein [Deltaproteobacteria bacterium]MBW2322706.1 hypothetical protein [Deltaproteobacteria bacterium]
MTEKEKKERLKDLASKKDKSFAEGESRPYIEMWPDEWAEWVSSHERRRNPRFTQCLCERPEFKASPFCGLGYH